jgi:lipopolysaccharide/colanic/teichoic acid biosynthesis glycosyltransferase
VTFYQRAGKRLFDLTVGLVLALVTLPVQILVAVLVRRDVGSPVLFSQERPGRDGKPFRLWKFRTMRDATDENGQPLPDEQRLTTFGRTLRSTSLDELPEFWNVVKGDMSLVGPRPLMMQYLTRYSPEQARRHEVRPGVTGWAQVNGRNDTTWAARLSQDVWYVDNLSFTLDLKILLRTVTTSLRRQGITMQGHATSAEFQGEGN